MPDRIRRLQRVREAMRHSATARAQNPSPEPEPEVAAPPPVPARREPPRRAQAELEQCEAEARYHRDRLSLYEARVYSGKPTSATRLRELERTAEGAEARLARARGR
jgi:hypothetical protein